MPNITKFLSKLRRSTSYIFIFACALLAPFVGLQTSYAQGNATIVGVVTDSSKAVVPGAGVTLTNTATGLQEVATTDSGGRYNFTGLPVGEYRIDVALAGFKKIAQTGVTLTAAQSLTVNLTLEVGQVSDTVEVSGAVTGLETVSSTVRSVVGHELIEDLPLNGRNALQLQTLLPGAINQSGARVSLSQEDGVSVNGARGNDNNVLLDGGHNNDLYDGTPTSMPNPDALQEFSVLSSSFSSEYGRGAGSLVTAVTKSGTNAFHGSLYEYLRNDKLDARSFFGHASLVNKPTLKRNQYGASVGGPIIKDKTFLFFSWESLRERSATTNTGQVLPTAAERSGDFSQSKSKPIDPLTGTRFPGDVIPASRLSKAAVGIGNLLFPLPNINGNQLISMRREATRATSMSRASTMHSRPTIGSTSATSITTLTPNPMPVCPCSTALTTGPTITLSATTPRSYRPPLSTRSLTR